MDWGLYSPGRRVSDLSKRFGYVLRRKREKADISQEELAERAGLHRNTLGLLERGQGAPTLVVVEKLAAALGTTMAKLVGEVERAKLPASEE